MAAKCETCETQYSCDNGKLLGNGSGSYCLVDYGAVTKYLVRNYCPNGMQKLDETKCSYISYTIILGTKIYECLKGGKASGNKCYVDTKKEYGYKCNKGYNLNGRCYDRVKPRKKQVCS